MPPLFIVATRRGWQVYSAHAEFPTLLRFDYSRHRIDRARVTTRMRFEALTVSSLNRMLTQCSCPLYESHLNIVDAGIAKIGVENPRHRIVDRTENAILTTSPSMFPKERLKESVSFYP